MFLRAQGGAGGPGPDGAAGTLGTPRSVGAGCAALFWAVGFYGVADLLALVGARGGMDAVAGLQASWGVLFTLIVGGGFVAMAARPLNPWPALVQLWTVAAALLLAAALTANVDPLVVAIMLVPMTAVGFAGPRLPPRRKLEADGLLFLLALAGAPAWWSYAAVAVERSLTPGVEDDVSWGLAHWPLQAARGIFMALIVLVMEFWPPGRPLHGTVCCASSTVLAAGWLLYPVSAGSVDSPAMSVLAVLWGAAVFACRFRGTGGGRTGGRPAAVDGPKPPGLRTEAPAAGAGRGPVRARLPRGTGRPWPDTEVLWPDTAGPRNA
ncbi:hypothetical protein HER39_08015 [Arthrobacter deserti]|uniref:Uncharacterized protein n=1 Tax=Arthrobacter deserti TaxID=1742687 RepID=A0ABX1JML0_9MICC|nr:hypothetical protein [Arthrobacter deserti]